MNYTWKLKSLKRKDSSDLKNIIVQTYWKKIGINSNGTEGVFEGATPFDLKTVNPNNFVPYEELTEEMVLSWIKSQVVGQYEQHVNEQIAKQIEEKERPVVEVTGGFPWEPEEEIIGTNGATNISEENNVELTPP